MSKLKVVALVMFIALVSGSCKKDYPKDIPDWLKDKIKVMKKESKDSGICCLKIDEYKFENNSIYWFNYPNSAYFGVYDFDGNQLCTFSIVPDSTCGYISNMHDYQFKRRIWTQKEK